jgi:phage tail sheath protein FI
MPQFGVFPSFASGTTPKLADPDGVLAIVFGTAPVDQIADAAARPINEARVCESFADFEAQFGEAPDGAFDTFTLSVAAEVLFNRYRVPRVLFVNVYDPDVHAGGVGDVDAADVAGADDGAGTLTGIEVTEAVYEQTGYVPTVFLAPGFGTDASVTEALRNKAARNQRSFYGFALQDLAPAQDNATAAVAAKGTAGSGGAALNDGHALPCWPAVTAQFSRAGESVTREEPASLHAAGMLYTAAAENGGVPASPSSQPLQALRPAVALTRADVYALRRAGIFTFGRRGRLGFAGQGNHTSAYLDGAPTAETVEDGLLNGDIAARLAANALANAAVLTLAEVLDAPLRKATLDRGLDALTLLGNRYKAEGATLGFSASYRPVDNPADKLAAGEVTYRAEILPPPALETVHVPLSVNLGFFDSLAG